MFTRYSNRFIVIEKIREPEDSEIKGKLSEAIMLSNAIFRELYRIRSEYGWEAFDRYHREAFSPPGISDEVLRRYAVYHYLIRSTPPWFCGLEIDMPGEYSLIEFAKAKLDELKMV